MARNNVLDLFSGIGGFSLGLESTGFFKTICFVEKDKFCQKVLQKNFPNIPIEDEVRNVKGEKYAAEVVTGGFPCQPFSVAGKRKGTDDDRYLWDETIRIVSEQKCKWFIGENVEGIINIQDGMVFRQIHDDLESEGFEVQSLIIPASGVGAWHQRKRVWIIANSNNDGSYRQKRNETKSSSYQSKEWLFVGNNKQDVWNTESTRRESSSMGPGKREFGRASSWGKQCESNWWKAQSKLCGVPNGVSFELDKDRKDRIKSLGNSIVPQIAREIGLAIMEAEIGTK
jgi:DNA (cytosine-5)-methyltransferase 1